MNATTPTTVRLSPDWLARLDALVGPGESRSHVIERAIAALEERPELQTAQLRAVGDAARALAEACAR